MYCIMLSRFLHQKHPNLELISFDPLSQTQSFDIRAEFKTWN